MSTDTPYAVLNDDHKRDIDIKRLFELEAAHYRVSLDLEDALAADDKQASEAMIDRLRTIGAQVSRAHARLAPPVVEAEDAA